MEVMFEQIKAFGPSILKVSIPQKIIDRLNLYVDQVISDKKKSEKLADLISSENIIVDHAMRYGNPSIKSKIAKLHEKESGVKIKDKHINIEDFYMNTDERFDVITCLEMLEHVPDPNSIINTCSKLLKPGGKIFFSTINKNLKAFLFAIIGAEYILNLLPKGTHEYKKFIKPSQLQAWTSRNNLSFDSIIGMSYNPITQKYKLSQDTSVNYIVEASSVND